MSSILTNTGAMVALQSLKSTNKGMAQIQNQIATGMKVANAKENASTWAIAQTMRSDVGGFKNIKSGLDTAATTVSVARNAAEQVSDLVIKIRDKVVEAQSDSVDRTKIQTDIVQFREQIKGIVSTAQFNGVNLLQDDSAVMNVLSSLDRSSNGVTAGNIRVSHADLRISESTSVANADIGDHLDLGGAGTPFGTIAGSAGTLTLEVDSSAAMLEGNTYTIKIGDNSKTFTAGANDDAESMAAKIAGEFSNSNLTASVAAGVITFTNNGADDLNVEVSATTVTAGTSGGLAALASLDVDVADPSAALEAMEELVSTAVDAAAAFGSSQMRIESQQEFMGKLIDSMNTGIGAMVDADMEEASARLQALQTQQQLGIQALSIANQAPQSVLSLFR